MLEFGFGLLIVVKVLARYRCIGKLGGLIFTEEASYRAEQQFVILIILKTLFVLKFVLPLGVGGFGDFLPIPGGYQGIGAIKVTEIILRRLPSISLSEVARECDYIVGIDMIVGTQDNIVKGFVTVFSAVAAHGCVIDKVPVDRFRILGQ